MDTRKRGRPGGGVKVNGGLKKVKQEMDFISTGLGSKSKPCTKFFSTAGCPFGEGCHFLHYVSGGFNAIAQMTNLGPTLPPMSLNVATAQPIPNGSAPPALKTRMCNKYNTAEGCRFGEKCHFAHGEWELGKPLAHPPPQEDPRGMAPVPSRFPSRMEPSLPGPTAGFGASATAKISVDASLAGAIIGKGGVNSKQICRQTGAKLFIRDHETDANQRNIELEGTFEQINEASALVRELIGNISSMGGPPKGVGNPAPPAGNFKTKMCENFTKGLCTFGERCHFAHGAAEMRSKQGV